MLGFLSHSFSLFTPIPAPPGDSPLLNWSDLMFRRYLADYMAIKVLGPIFVRILIKQFHQLDSFRTAGNPKSHNWTHKLLCISGIPSW